jgi:hypothetical protein
LAFSGSNILWRVLGFKIGDALAAASGLRFLGGQIGRLTTASIVI